MVIVNAGDLTVNLSHPITWAIPAHVETAAVSGFALGFQSEYEADLRALAEALPESVVLCSPLLIAGVEHLRMLTFQTVESWNRGLSLARNKSIELLMRLCCKSQISEAIRSSRVSSTSVAAIFGISPDPGKALAGLGIVNEHLAGSRRLDSLLDLDEAKMTFLQETHSIPKTMNAVQLRNLLLEKSALLIESR